MNLLETPTKRKLLFAALYLSEGAPIGFLWWALPTKLRAAGVPVVEITTLISLLAFPWALKFLWAPLIDTLRSSRWSLRHWIITAQVAMGLALIPLLFLDLREHFSFVLPLLVFHAISAATQDVSVDALAISSTTQAERGTINGWMQAGMLTGRAVFGGGALLVGSLLSNDAVILSLVAVIWSSTILVAASRQDSQNVVMGQPLSGRARQFLKTFTAMLTRRSTWFGLGFAAVAGAGFEAVGAVAGPYMIDRGFSSDQVGLFFAVPSILGMVGGALLGGYASDRIGRRSTVAYFLGVLSISILLLSIADAWVPGFSHTLLSILLAFFYFSIGLFTASSYALFMDVTDPRLGATQFSTFMGATNFCESWSTFTVGKLIGGFGYAPAFGIMAAISLIALPSIPFLKPIEDRR